MKGAKLMVYKKEQIYEFIQKEFFAKEKYADGIDTLSVSTALHMQRSNVSAILNELVRDGELLKTATRPVKYTLATKKGEAEGQNQLGMLIGANGSLKNAVTIAKTSILYPKYNLNLMISSAPGCGTSELVSAMYHFAKYKKVMSPEGQLFSINCQNYKNNPDEIDRRLFETENGFEDSLFTAAKKGILFIDHADIMNATQQARILDFLDSGFIHNASHTLTADCHDVFLVLSCSREGGASFRQKIFTNIELPSFAERPMQERLELINHFFSREAALTKRYIQVSSETLKALILYDFPQNVRELSAEIKSLCAKGFLRAAENPTKDIRIFREDLEPKIQISLKKIPQYSQELYEAFGESNMFHYDKEKGYLKHELPASPEKQKQMPSEEEPMADTGTSIAGNPVLLYLFQGSGLASALKDVTNHLTQNDNTYGYDIPFDIPTERLKEELALCLRRIDAGGGVIILYDSSWLEPLLEQIQAVSPIRFYCLQVPIIKLGEHIARQCLTESNLSLVHHNAHLQLSQFFHYKERKKELIVALGPKGGIEASQIKRYIDQYSKMGLWVVALDISDGKKLFDKLLELKRTFHIHCIIGTYNPQIMDIPFISALTLFENDKRNIDQVLMFEPVSGPLDAYERVYGDLEANAEFISISKLKTLLPQMIDQMFTFYMPDDEKKAAVFEYLAWLPENILAGKGNDDTIDTKRIIFLFREDFLILSKMLKPLEKTFKIIISDNAIAKLIFLFRNTNLAVQEQEVV